MAPRKAGFLARLVKHRALLLMLVPAVAYYVLFQYRPMYGLQIAFRDYRFNLGILGSPWVGLQNLRELFSAISFASVFRNTVIISFLKLLFGFPAPILFAILINEVRNSAYKRVSQTISYLPYFLSWVVLAGVFAQLLSPLSGPLNLLIKALGGKSIYFLGDAHYFRGTLVATSIWKGFGWGSVVYLAAIAGINPELYEAAIIDGANRFGRTIHITLPSIANVVTIMLIFAVGGIFTDDFDQIVNLYNPAVYGVGDVLSTFTYRKGLLGMDYSFATAVGLLQNGLSFILIVVANFLMKRISEYGIW